MAGDGGSAFPVIGKHSSQGRMEMDSPGMTLRDWYAGQALNAIIPRPKTIEEFESITDFDIAFAKAAYQIADAVIKIREGDNAAETA
jgi:hypothetical protein